MSSEISVLFMRFLSISNITLALLDTSTRISVLFMRFHEEMRKFCEYYDNCVLDISVLFMRFSGEHSKESFGEFSLDWNFCSLYEI